MKQYPSFTCPTCGKVTDITVADDTSLQVGSKLICEGCTALLTVRRNLTVDLVADVDFLLHPDIAEARKQQAERLGDRGWLDPHSEGFDQFNPYWIELTPEEQETAWEAGLTPWGYAKAPAPSDVKWTVGRDPHELCVVGAGPAAEFIITAVAAHHTNSGSVLTVTGLGDQQVHLLPTGGQPAEQFNIPTGTIQIVVAGPAGEWPWDTPDNDNIVLGGPTAYPVTSGP